MNNFKSLQKIRTFGIFTLILITGVGGYLHIGPFDLKVALKVEDILHMLGIFAVLSLFQERAIEVFLSLWRSAKADALDFEVNRAAEIKSTVQPADPAWAERVTALETATKNRMEYRIESRHIALVSSVILGAIISALGVQGLHQLLNTSDMTPNQQKVFTLYDILITTGILAGGSEGINKLTKMVESLVQATSNKAKLNTLSF